MQRSVALGAPTACRALVALALVATATPNWAQGSASQEDADAESFGWRHSSELSFVSTSGNSQTDSFGVQHLSERTFATGRFEIDMAGVRVESTSSSRFAVGLSPESFEVVDLSQREVTAENYHLRGRYERRLSERLFAFAGAGWERNVFAGVRNRASASGGIGHTWFQGPDGHLRTDYALTVTRQEDVRASSEDFLGLRLGWDYGRRLTETASFASALIVDGNLDDSDDLRADFKNSISVSINERLALKVGAQLLFDNKPSLEELELRRPSGEPTGETVLVPVEDLDSVLRAALVVSF